MVRGVERFCQTPLNFAVAVAGVAGSGKSTLGAAIADATRSPMLDLDTLTNPLLDAIGADLGPGHWVASPSAAIRDGRYAALRATAREIRRTTGSVVLVAPFTTELRGGDAADQLRKAVGEDLVFVRLVGDPEIVQARRTNRGIERDHHRPPDEPVDSPGVPVVDIDVELSTPQQLARALVAVGVRRLPAADSPLWGERFDAVLFDLDGTLADSTASVARSWRRLASEFGLPPESVNQSHGLPASQQLQTLVPQDRMGDAIARIFSLEIDDAQHVRAGVGAREFYNSVPEDQRAIVTSGNRELALARLRAAGLAPPAVFVTSDDVVHAKPAPEPYLLAMARMGLDGRRCLALEDSPAGVASAKAAGCRVVGVGGTVAPEALLGADLVVDALDALDVRPGKEGLALVPRDVVPLTPMGA